MTVLINDLTESFFTPDEDDEYALKIVRDALEHLHEQLMERRSPATSVQGYHAQLPDRAPECRT